MAFHKGVEYIPDESGTAIRVKCPLVDNWIEPIDCLENQSIKAEHIPDHFKEKENWTEIFKNCPFRDY